MDVATMTAGIRAGDEAAFEAFHQAYAPRMLRYVLVVTRGNDTVAHEVHQDSLLRVIRSIKVLVSDEDLWRHLTVCMRSAWLDFLRRRRNAERRTRPPMEQTEAPGMPLSEEVASDHLHELLGKSLQELGEPDRQLIMEHYFQGRSQMELAESYAVPVKTLAMRLVRLRRNLRDAIMEGLRHG